MDLRSGLGIDFHRLLSAAQRPLLLGGVEIAGELALEGHSDADIILHALSDAILGALGLADIGDYFPDSDAKNRNLPSSQILNFALLQMKKAGYKLSNADITIVGEKPRIQPHRETIKKQLATLLAITAGRIAVKATTTEKMGALGRNEGLGCLALVLLVDGQ